MLAPLAGVVCDRFVQGQKTIPQALNGNVRDLVEKGLLEGTGRGRYVLSRRFYGFLGKKGVYTRRRGLERQRQKQLLLQHLDENKREGSRFSDLWEVLPNLTRGEVRQLLRELKKEGRAQSVGRTRAARWYPT